MKSTLWHRFHIVDDAPRLHRPLIALASCVALVLLVDLLLAIALAPRRAQPDIEIRNASDLREQLRRAADAPGKPWLLIGDSVLAGDVLLGRVDKWQRRRVIDEMRRLQSPESAQRFFQVGLSGLLPVDALRVVSELDRIDPEGRVNVCLQLNPRYFSPHYASQPAPTRLWIERLAPPLPPECGFSRTLALIARNGAAFLDTVGDHLPIYRHRRAFNLSENTESRFAPRDEPASPPDPLAGAARILEHYRNPVLTDESLQVRALVEIRDRLEARGRRGLFFQTPLNDTFMRQARADAERGDDAAALARILDRPGIRFTDLDHPLFVPSHFVDHCHLLPEGNRLLALNLLADLDVRFTQEPDWEELVYDEGVDTSLVDASGRGSREGPPWLAAFNRPRGLALLPSGDLAIADTENHCLRRYDVRNRVVGPLAGRPGEPGRQDGSAREALLERPMRLCAMNDALFFTDAAGTRLRRLEHGQVLTDVVFPHSGITSVTAMRRHNGRLYLLADECRLAEYDPPTRRIRRIATFPEIQLRAFDIAPHGRLFLGDGFHRILHADLEEVLASPAPHETVRVLFASRGDFTLPVSGRDFEKPYPMDFEEARLQGISDIRYVERYDGILVQDEARHKKPDPNVTQRMRMRLLRLPDKRVYPWIKPQISNQFYAMWHRQTEGYVSRFHYGSMAFEQETATLYYLERERSRLFRMSDGLVGASKLSQTPTTEWRNGIYYLRNLRTDRYLPERIQRHPRRGPYLGLIVGSSMVATSEMIRGYTIGYWLDRDLKRMLAYRDGIGFDLVCSATPMNRLSWSFERLEQLLTAEVGIDVAFFTLDWDWSLKEMDAPEQMAAYLRDLAGLCETYGVKVVFVDNSGMYAMKGDGLRGAPGKVRAFLEMARGAGFDTIEPTSTLLRESLEQTPWGSPHVFAGHAAPWAIRATSRVLAQRAYPLLRKWFEGRTPAILQTPKPLAPVDPERLITAAIPTLDAAAERIDPVPVTSAALRTAYRNRRMSALVDLTKIALYRRDKTPAAVRRIALSALHEVLQHEIMAARATEIELRLVTFRNFNEYGQGVLDSAVDVFRKTMGREEIEALALRPENN